MPGFAKFGAHLSWADAFQKLNDHLSRAYALGEWKRIVWKKVYDATAHKIAEASRNGDRATFYAALLENLWTFHDGHRDRIETSRRDAFDVQHGSSLEKRDEHSNGG